MLVALRHSLLLCATALATESRYASAQSSHGEATTLGGRSVVVWEPSVAPGSKAPVVVFSHGFLGCATQSTFLTEALARHGYWVVAPQHADATCGNRAERARRGRSRAQKSFINPDAWSDSTYADRAADVRAIIDAIARDPQLSLRVDLDRLSLVGHSLGGYTVVGLAGGWAAWTLPKVRAVIALSPYTEPFVRHHTLSGLTAPVMYQGGTADFGITPFVQREGGAYDESPTPKYFVDFTGAGHFAWTDFPSPLHEQIEQYAIAFLDHYARGVSTTTALTSKMNGVAELRYDISRGQSR